jgi:hypothetical protein
MVISTNSLEATFDLGNFVSGRNSVRFDRVQRARAEPLDLGCREARVLRGFCGRRFGTRG